MNSNFFYLINSIKKHVHKNLKSGLKNHNINPPHGLYLRVLLDYKEGLTLTELTQMLDFDKANTTRIINELINLDYIKKEENKLKKYKIVLTKEGLKKARIVKNEVCKIHNQAFKDFSKEEKQEFERLIIKFINNIKKEEGI